MGQVYTTRQLRKAFGKTHNVLAKDYKLRAGEFWVAEKIQETGHAMIAASGHLAHAAKWTGSKIENAAVASGKVLATGGKAVGRGAATAGVESFRGVRWLGGKLIKGVALVPSKVGEGLAWLGQGICKVGAEVEPEKKN